ncbi:MAG: helix-turn-helix domain-containing protein [Candidatus Aminicenantes bacterium]|nr:helix-turn-helix domain-containing protein [Candidatus Aminicenantes bacterium]
MATENLDMEQNTSPFQSPVDLDSFASQQQEKIRPEYLEEWKERSFRREVFDLFIEYFCLRQRVPFKKLIGSVEKGILIRTLSQFNGCQKSAAKFLGIKYTTLNEKIKRYNIRFDKRPI